MKASVLMGIVNIKIHGLIWLPESDGIKFSAEVEGQFCYMLIDTLEAKCKEYGRLRGWDVGKTCDVINSMIRAEEERVNPSVLKGSFKVSGEEARKTLAMFWPDYQPTSRPQDADKVDGRDE